MRTGARAYRDSVAFALTILGATVWAAFPAIAILRGEGIGAETAIMIIFAAGALIGAWTGATMWKHVSWPTPAVAAAVVAAVITAFRARHKGVDPGAFEAGFVLAAAAGAVAGTWLGWRTREARRVLATVWITISAPALVGVGLGVLDLFDLHVGRAAIWLILLSFAPGASLAARICGAVPPRVFAASLFGLLLLAVGTVAVSALTRAKETGGALAWSGGFWIVVPTLLAFVPMRRRYVLHPAPAEMPTATIVDR